MNRRSDAGFGLVEIVVSMLVLALLALALIPLLVQSLQLTARNAAIAAGVQYANDVLQAAHRESPDCAAVEALAGTQTFEARGVPISVTTTVGSCPADASDPLTVKVHSLATRTDTNDMLADVSTLVFVELP